MKIVSSISNDEVAKHRARKRLDYSLRLLAANLLRIIRGAGKPSELAGQISGYMDCCVAYRDAFGHWPSNKTISTIVAVSRARTVDEWIAGLRKDIDEATVNRWLQDGTYDLSKAEDEIVRAAMQLAAARLLAQRTQEVTARHDLLDAVRSLEEAQRKHLAALGIRSRRGPRKSDRAMPTLKE